MRSPAILTQTKMRKITLLLIFLSKINLSAQSFTNGSVYDFNIGDTIVTAYTHFTNAFGGSEPPMTTYRVFTNKYYSPSQDTVFYIAHDVVSGYTNAPFYIPTISSYTVKLVVTNLNASAINFAFTSSTCGPRVDTSYINDCGMHEHHAYLDNFHNNDSCFEPPTIDYRIVEGVGIFEHVLYLNGFPVFGGNKTQLLWFRKGNKRCGDATAIPNGIQEWSITAERLRVYPNPSDGIYTVEIKGKGMFSVSNPLGERVYTNSLPEGASKIDLTNFPSGVYFMTCISENKIFTARIVKQ